MAPIVATLSCCILSLAHALVIAFATSTLLFVLFGSQLVDKLVHYFLRVKCIFGLLAVSASSSSKFTLLWVLSVFLWWLSLFFGIALKLRCSLLNYHWLCLVYHQVSILFGWWFVTPGKYLIIEVLMLARSFWLSCDSLWWVSTLSYCWFTHAVEHHQLRLQLVTCQNVGRRWISCHLLFREVVSFEKILFVLILLLFLFVLWGCLHLLVRGIVL